MNYNAHIHIMPHDTILDPQGQAVNDSLKKLGFQTIENVRVGKKISFSIHADSKEIAQNKAKEACEKLLVNKIVESYKIEILEN